MPFAWARAELGVPTQSRFPRRSRIRRGSEIRAILGSGTRARTSHFDVYTRPAPVSWSRFGTIVPKHRRTIVERNRLKRRIREVGRTEVLPTLAERAQPLDVLVRARSGAYDLTYQQIRAELSATLQEMR